MISLNGVQKLAPAAVSFYTGKYEQLFPSIKESYRLELDSFFTTSNYAVFFFHSLTLSPCFIALVKAGISKYLLNVPAKK